MLVTATSRDVKAPGLSARHSRLCTPRRQHRRSPRRRHSSDCLAGRADRAARIAGICDTLAARISEAQREGWLDEIERLKISLASADDKLAQINGRTVPSLSATARQPCRKHTPIRTSSAGGTGRRDGTDDPIAGPAVRMPLDGQLTGAFSPPVVR